MSLEIRLTIICDSCGDERLLEDAIQLIGGGFTFNHDEIDEIEWQCDEYGGDALCPDCIREAIHA